MGIPQRHVRLRVPLGGSENNMGIPQQHPISSIRTVGILRHRMALRKIRKNPKTFTSYASASAALVDVTGTSRSSSAIAPWVTLGRVSCRFSHAASCILMKPKEAGRKGRGSEMLLKILHDVLGNPTQR